MYVKFFVALPMLFFIIYYTHNYFLKIFNASDMFTKSEWKWGEIGNWHNLIFDLIFCNILNFLLLARILKFHIHQNWKQNSEYLWWLNVAQEKW